MSRINILILMTELFYYGQILEAIFCQSIFCINA